MIENKHKVHKRQWKKWSDRGQAIFNSLYEHMTLQYTDDDGNVTGEGAGQYLYTHPKSIPMPHDLWTTTAWNAAWMAADLIRDYDKQIESQDTSLDVATIEVTEENN